MLDGRPAVEQHVTVRRLSAEQATTADCPAAIRSSILAAIAASQGQRSSSVSGSPAASWSRGAEEDAGGGGQGEQDGLGQELDADVALGGAEGAAQADFGASFEDGDDHDVGDSAGADEEGDGAEEQGVERGLGVGLGGQRGRRPGDVDLLRVLGVGLRRQEVVRL
jgi:hypothetical protein